MVDWSRLNPGLINGVAGVLVAAAAAVLAGGLVLGIIAGEGSGGGGSVTATGVRVAAGPGDVTINISDFQYAPQELTVASGTEVRWTNLDRAPHTATDISGGWDTGALKQDGAATLAFDEPGEYEYYCIFHPSMKARLNVR
jgi:plastocyanin